MEESENDKNLMVVEAIEGYALNHGMQPREVFLLFRNNGILELLRTQYKTLHTQSMEESIYFVEDILRRVLDAK